MKFHCLNILLLIKLIYSTINICSNPCSTCQNSLYYLKLQERLDCRFTLCPDICLKISTEYNSNNNEHIIMFRKDLISICEVCFRLEQCHISQCQEQKGIMKNVLNNSIKNQIDFHLISIDKGIQQDITRTLKDFCFNTEVIFTNLHRTLVDLEEYVSLYTYSYKLKEIHLGKNFNEKKDFMHKLELILQDFKTSLGKYQSFKEKFLSSSLFIIANYQSVMNELKQLEGKIDSLVKNSNALLEEIKESIDSNINIMNQIRTRSYLHRNGVRSTLSSNTISPLSQTHFQGSRMKEIKTNFSRENFSFKHLMNETHKDSNKDNSSIDDFINRRNQIIMNDSLLKKVNLDHLINVTKEGEKIIRESYGLSKIKELSQELNKLSNGVLLNKKDKEKALGNDIDSSIKQEDDILQDNSIDEELFDLTQELYSELK